MGEVEWMLKSTVRSSSEAIVGFREEVAIEAVNLGSDRCFRKKVTAQHVAERTRSRRIMVESERKGSM